MLSAAHDRTEWEENGRSDRPQKEIPCVYDKRGQGIRVESPLERTLDGGDQLWIVPAIAVETVPSETGSTSARAEIPTLTVLECQHCRSETEPRFSIHESLPDET